MKKTLIVILVLIINITAFSQEKVKKNELFLELGGNGLLGSVNYQRQFTDKQGFGFRVGLGAYGTGGFLTIPVGVNYLIRVIKNHSFLDLGIGATYTKADFRVGIIDYMEGAEPEHQNLNYMASVGLRAYTTKNFVWRVSVAAVKNQHGYAGFPGLGFGKRF